MSSRRRGTPIDENVRLEQALREQESQEALQNKLKGMVYHLFGENNIMFDCEITAGLSRFQNRAAYTYTMTCKLCLHVTKRTQKTNLYLCAGCYREWDPETNTILKPSNPTRVSRAKENGKLVLPCDESEEETSPQPDTPKPTPPCENPIIREVTMKIVELGPGESFYHKESNTLFMGKA